MDAEDAHHLYRDVRDQRYAALDGKRPETGFSSAPRMAPRGRDAALPPPPGRHQVFRPQGQPRQYGHAHRPYPPRGHMPRGPAGMRPQMQQQFPHAPMPAGAMPAYPFATPPSFPGQMAPPMNSLPPGRPPHLGPFIAAQVPGNFPPTHPMSAVPRGTPPMQTPLGSPGMAGSGQVRFPAAPPMQLPNSLGISKPDHEATDSLAEATGKGDESFEAKKEVTGDKKISDEDMAASKAWAAHKSDSGQVYYYNSLTNESSWSKPEGFTGEATDAKPTSQLRVPGTQWFEIHCEDGRKYYYNDASEETSWTVPDDVAALKQQVKDAKAHAPLSAVNAVNKANNQLPYNPPPGMEDVTYSVEDVKIEPRKQPINQPGIDIPPLPAEIPPPQPPPEHLRKKSLEELTSAFYDLLSEKSVTAFSRWEKELPKLIGDERYKAMASMKDRKAAFEEYCRDTGVQRQRAKAGSQAGAGSLEEARAGFRTLMAEASARLASGEAANGAQPILHSETMYTELESRYSNDSRWQACSETLREEMFDKRIEEIKVKIKEEEAKRKSTAESNYRTLLASSSLSGSSRWSKSKDTLAKDPAYKAVSRDLRETLFREYVAQKKKEEDSRERERQEQERKEQGKKERLRKETEEADNRRRKAAHTDALANYLTLLNESVKDPEARWGEWKHKLQRDPQKRASNPALDSKEAESVFKDHITELHKKAFTAFSEHMDQILRPLLPKNKQDEMPSPLRSFKAADKLWEDDTRTLRLTAREREKLWRRYVDELILERDNPSRLTGRTRVTDGRKAAVKDRSMLRDGKQERDQAYEREYLAHDRKRLKRD